MGTQVSGIVTSVLGGAIGVFLGFTGAELIARFTGWGTVVVPETVAVVIVFSAAVGIFFGFYPVRKAAALNPIDALRFE